MVAALQDARAGRRSSCRRRTWARWPAAWAASGRPRPAGLLRQRCSRGRPGPDRRARAAARGRAEERPAHRVPPAAAESADVTRLAATRCRRSSRASSSAWPAATSRGRRCRICRDAARDRRRPVRRGGAQGRPRRGAHPGVPGRYHVLGGAIARWRRRARHAADPGAADPAGAADDDHRGDHRHRPEHRGRGDGDLPRPPVRDFPGLSVTRRPPGCRWAATSSSPTS